VNVEESKAKQTEKKKAVAVGEERGKEKQKKTAANRGENCSCRRCIERGRKANEKAVTKGSKTTKNKNVQQGNMKTTSFIDLFPLSPLIFINPQTVATFKHWR